VAAVAIAVGRAREAEERLGGLRGGLAGAAATSPDERSEGRDVERN